MWNSLVKQPCTLGDVKRHMKIPVLREKEYPFGKLNILKIMSMSDKKGPVIEKFQQELSNTIILR